MKRGPKPKTTQELITSGTYQTSRHGSTRTNLVEPHELPQAPDWLTEEGHEVWLDNIGRVSQSKGAGELDSALFANYCNAQGFIVSCWRNGSMPRVQLLSEVRKMQELLRIAGPSSRANKLPTSGAGSTVIDANPFTANGRQR